MVQTGAAAPDDLWDVAAEALAALDTGCQIKPFSLRLGDFDLYDAYQVAEIAKGMREARGETPVGRKIGFTNRATWTEFNVREPNWGYMYDRTVHDLDAIGGRFPLAVLAEPRIEPEIVFRLAAAPAAGMDEAALLSCIDWVAHGFELVQSMFPKWRFTPEDAVAAFCMHGALLIGPRHAIAGNAENWSRTLPTFELDLTRNGTVVDRGCGANVLGGPISALRHLIELSARDEGHPPLAAGEIVTTGTLTRALPVAAGETWTTDLRGIALDGISVRFA